MIQADGAFEELGGQLDRESYEWVTEHFPDIGDAIERSIKRGATPEQVRAFVLRRCGSNRIEFARRCEAAARHLAQAA